MRLYLKLPEWPICFTKYSYFKDNLSLSIRSSINYNTICK